MGSLRGLGLASSASADVAPGTLADMIPFPKAVI